MSFIEMAQNLTTAQLAAHVNSHMESKMFLVGLSVTAADVTVLAFLLSYFQNLSDLEKTQQLPHAFRWLDHVQHLPGLLEQVQTLSLFVEFPDENVQPISKA